jgi:hypothetical protein
MQQGRLAQQQAMQAQQPATAPAAPGAMTDEKIAQLQARQLKTAGVLTEEEFEAQKPKSWRVSAGPLSRLRSGSGIA